MDTTKTRFVLIAVLSALLTFVLMAVPISAHTSTNAMASNCNCDHDCNTKDIQSSIPACCSISNGAFSDCVLSEVPDNEAILPNSVTLSLDVHNNQCVQSVSTEVTDSSKQLLEQESPQLSPTRFYSEYHCRNSLNSEEPLLS